MNFLSKFIYQHPPQGLYLYGGNKAVSKVKEVVAVKEIKLNELTNIQLVHVLCLNVKRHIRGSIVEKPANDS